MVLAMKVPASPALRQPPLQQLPWDDLRLLLLCQRLGSLTAAADALDCHVATASRRLSAIEAALGVALFRRGKTGLTATPAGAALQPAIEAAEAAILQVWRCAQGVETEVGGVVRLSMPAGVADSLVVPLLGKMRGLYPGLRVEIDASTRYVDLERGEADIALRTRRPASGALVAQRLVQARMAVMGAPHLVEQAAPRHLRELTWLAWDHDLAHLPESQWLAAHVPDTQIALRCNDHPVLMAAARRGLGVMLAAQAEGQQLGLVPVPLHPADQAAVDALPSGVLWMACHSALRQVPRVAAVWTFLQGEIADLRRAGVAV